MLNFIGRSYYSLQFILWDREVLIVFRLQLVYFWHDNFRFFHSFLNINVHLCIAWIKSFMQRSLIRKQLTKGDTSTYYKHWRNRQGEIGMNTLLRHKNKQIIFPIMSPRFIVFLKLACINVCEVTKNNVSNSWFIKL